MNYIKHLTGFFNKSNQDDGITPAHVSLYFALFQRWNLNRFRNPIIISRAEIMRSSKIKSKATYHKCIKDLHLLGYIIYKPSFNSYEGTEVILPDLSSVMELQKASQKNTIKKKECSSNSNKISSKNDAKKTNSTPHNDTLQQNTTIFDRTSSNINRTSSNFDRASSNSDNPSSKDEQALKFINRTGSTIEQPKKEKTETLTNTDKSEACKSVTSSTNERTVPANEHDKKNGYILYNNTINKLNNNLFNSNTISSVGVKNEKKENEISKKQKFTPPHLESIQAYFLDKNANVLEAEKFFNYYASNGWLVGGKSKMKDWQAAARNWIINSEKFNTKTPHPELVKGPKPNHLHVKNFKNYAEPH